VPELLRALEDFTNAISPADTTADNGAMKAVLSVVHELLNLEGANIVNSMGNVQPDSTLAQYITQMLGLDSLDIPPPQPSARQLSSPKPAAPALPPPPFPSPAALVSPAGMKRQIEIRSSPKIGNSGVNSANSSATPSRRTTGGNEAPAGSHPLSSDESFSSPVEASPSAHPSNYYREQLSALKSAGSVATQSPSPRRQITPPSNLPPPVFHSPSPSNATAGSTATVASAPPSALPPPFPKAASSLEQIRARFQAAKVTGTEVEGAGSASAASSKRGSAENVGPSIRSVTNQT
jgi:hypothetical protein